MQPSVKNLKSFPFEDVIKCKRNPDDEETEVDHMKVLPSVQDMGGRCCCSEGRALTHQEILSG
jgi:hypothetical protein